MDRDLDEVLELLRTLGLRSAPDSAVFRVARAMRCEVCGVRTELLDWFGSQAAFACPECGRIEVVEIPMEA